MRKTGRGEGGGEEKECRDWGEGRKVREEGKVRRAEVIKWEIMYGWG